MKLQEMPIPSHCHHYELNKISRDSQLCILQITERKNHIKIRITDSLRTHAGSHNLSPCVSPHMPWSGQPWL
jgi:hypothetical protein